MTAHVVDIDTQHSWANGDQVLPARYRWRCSCGAMGIWKPKAINARRGGVQHVQKLKTR